MGYTRVFIIKTLVVYGDMCDRFLVHGAFSIFTEKENSK